MAIGTVNLVYFRVSKVIQLDGVLDVWFLKYVNNSNMFEAKTTQNEMGSYSWN